jgi:hypothetical protein
VFQCSAPQPAGTRHKRRTRAVRLQELAELLQADRPIAVDIDELEDLAQLLLGERVAAAPAVAQNSLRELDKVECPRALRRGHRD